MSDCRHPDTHIHTPHSLLFRVNLISYGSLFIQIFSKLNCTNSHVLNSDVEIPNYSRLCHGDAEVYSLSAFEIVLSFKCCLDSRPIIPCFPSCVFIRDSIIYPAESLASPLSGQGHHNVHLPAAASAMKVAIDQRRIRALALAPCSHQSSQSTTG